MKKKTIIAAVILISACSPKIITLTQMDADRGAKKFPGTTMETLATGKTNYERYCQKCHGLKSPTSRSEEKWNQIMPIMAKKAKIDDATKESITQYLLTMCKKG